MAGTHSVGLVLRGALALTLALAWLLAAGAPASAEVTGWTVDSPQPDSPLIDSTELLITVYRTASPPEEKVEVRTRLLAGPAEDGTATPVSQKVISLAQTDQFETDPGSDQLRFTGTIDPDALVWLPDGGVARNGRYMLQYQFQITTGDFQREPSEWQSHPIVIDAPPLPAGAPTVEVADAAERRLRVDWDPSPTPDLLRYVVERRLDGGPWKIAEEIAPDRSRFRDTVKRPGSYRYRVSAVRPAGDGTGDVRTTVGAPSPTTELEPPAGALASPPPVPSPPAATTEGSGPGAAGFGPQAAEVPGIRPPADANTTYEGPLDYGVEQQEVTERVPVEVAAGGTSEDAGTLEVLSRSVDRERVLPAVAGGLILLVSAAHVLRYLNE